MRAMLIVRSNESRRADQEAAGNAEAQEVDANSDRSSKQSDSNHDNLDLGA